MPALRDVATDVPESFRADATASPSPDQDVLYAFLNGDDRGGYGRSEKLSLTIDEAAARLTRTGLSWSSIGQPAMVTYAFRSTVPAVMPDDTSGFTRFNDAQIAATIASFQAWSDVAKITFERVSNADGYSNDATILLGNYSSGSEGAAAFAFMPGNWSTTSSSGDIWVNGSEASNSNPMLLNYGQHTLVHEIGHAIGLSHPAAYNASADATITYGADATYNEDSRQYTVMSYFSERSTGGSFQGRYSAVPLLDDIAAAQRLYGANMATRTGDTIYGFHSNADRPWFLASDLSTRLVFAIWDAGGVDTLDFSGYNQAQTIDLREGGFSSVGGLVGNVAIAIGASIENAIGGSGDDKIFGNSGNNIIWGLAGNDTIDGGLGADTAVFSGNRAAYTLEYNGQLILITGPDGIDYLYNFEFLQFADQTMSAPAVTGQLTLVGDVRNNIITGSSTVDYLRGMGGNDTLNGLDGPDELNGGYGDDILNGGAGSDTLYGGPGNDVLNGGAGYDIASYEAAYGGVTVSLALGTSGGADGQDTLIDIEEIVGSGYNDVITGSNGSDVLRGGGGIDHLYGGAGNDFLYAGRPGEGGGAADVIKGASTANASIASAVSLDDSFDMLANPEILTDTYIPHATVFATTHGGVEYYAVTLGANQRITVDIDNANFDSILKLYDANGNVLAENDDGGSDGFNATDSQLIFNVSVAGVYYIAVGLWLTNVDDTFTSGAPPAGSVYTMHVSASGHAFAPTLMIGSTLDGGDGDDFLYTQFASGPLIGGDGNDTAVIYSDSRDAVISTTNGVTTVTDGGVITLTGIERLQFFDRTIILAATNSTGTAGPDGLTGTAGADTLHGLAGDDMLDGGAGSDVIDGGDGIDTLILSGQAASYYFERTTAGWKVYDGGQDIDTVTNVEQVRFGNAAAVSFAAAAAAGFDAYRYMAGNVDLIGWVGTNPGKAYQHYLTNGQAEGRPLAAFDGLTYVASNPDLIGYLGADERGAARYYVQNGYFEGRTVTGFNALLYTASNVDLARWLGVDPAAATRHYIQNGFFEGRQTGGFDPLVYAASNVDLARWLGVDPTAALNHYLTNGADEGRATNTFDPLIYAATYVDLARWLGVDPAGALNHYLNNGADEGRATGGFDPVGYLLSNADLSGLTPRQALEHWLSNGADEGRIGDWIFGREQASHALTGASTAGVVDQSGDRDWFQITLTAGQNVSLTVAAAGGGAGTLSDGVVAVYDTNGRYVAFDNDSGPGLDAALQFTAGGSGTYYIVVAGNGAPTGSYKLQVAISAAAQAALANADSLADRTGEALWSGAPFHSAASSDDRLAWAGLTTTDAHNVDTPAGRPPVHIDTVPDFIHASWHTPPFHDTWIV